MEVIPIGLDYVFPSGSVLAARSYLTLAKSTAAFAAAYGLKVPVFGQFNGQLNTAGQTIAHGDVVHYIPFASLMS